MEKNALPVIYNAEKQKFEPSDYTDAANYCVVEFLNKYVQWSPNAGRERDFQLQNFLRGVENTFNEIKTEFHYVKLTNGLTEENRATIQFFIDKFYWFSPEGLLSAEEKIQIRAQLNSYCEALKSEFLQETAALEIIPEVEKVTSVSQTANISFSFSNYFNRIFKTGIFHWGMRVAD